MHCPILPIYMYWSGNACGEAVQGKSELGIELPRTESFLVHAHDGSVECIGR